MHTMLIYGHLISLHAHVSPGCPALNGSSALQRFERSNTVEIRNGITFGFYPGLSHI